MLVCPCDLMSQSLIDRLGSYMIGSTFLKLLPTAHLHLRRDLSPETSKNTYPVNMCIYNIWCVSMIQNHTVYIHIIWIMAISWNLDWCHFQAIQRCSGRYNCPCRCNCHNPFPSHIRAMANSDVECLYHMTSSFRTAEINTCIGFSKRIMSSTFSFIFGRIFAANHALLPGVVRLLPWVQFQSSQSSILQQGHFHLENPPFFWCKWIGGPQKKNIGDECGDEIIGLDSFSQ